MKNRFSLLACSFAFGLWTVGCGGGSDELSVNNVDNVTGTFDALEGLLDSVQSNSNSSKLSSRSQNSQSQGSLAGCHTNEEIDRTIDNMRELRVNVCAVKALNDNGVISIPKDGSYGYAHVMASSGVDGGNQALDTKVRTRYFTDASGNNCLQLDRCEKNSQDIYVQIHSFQVCDQTNGSLKGLIAKNRNTNFENSHERTHWFQVEAYGTVANNTVDLATLDLETAFDDFWGSGHGVLSASKADKRIDMNWKAENSFTDTQDNTFSNDYLMCAITGKGEGLVNFSGTMGMPSYADPNNPSNYYCPPDPDNYQSGQQPSTQGATCLMDYNHTEAYAISSASSGLDFTLIQDPSQSIWASALNANCQANSVAIPANYVNDWDCTAEGGSFADATVTPNTAFGDDLKACFDRNTSKFKDGYQSCDELYRSNNL